MAFNLARRGYEKIWIEPPIEYSNIKKLLLYFKKLKNPPPTHALTISFFQDWNWKNEVLNQLQVEESI